MPLALADGRGVVVLRAAVIAEVHLSGGIGVGEPPHRVAPGQQQGQLKRLIRGVAELPAEHRHRIAGALVIPGEDGTEGFAQHIGPVDVLEMGPTEGVTGGVGAGAAALRAGGVPLPGAQGPAAVGVAVITLRCRGQGMGTDALALPLPEGELTIGNRAEPVLSSIEVPEVEGPAGGAAKAASPETPEGHAVVGAIVEVAGVPHRVGRVPAQAEAAAPAGLRRLPWRSSGATTPQQRTQSGESEAGHAGWAVAPDCQVSPAQPALKSAGLSSASNRASRVTAVRTNA